MLNFNSTIDMNSSHQFQKHSNPNPSFDQFKHNVCADLSNPDSPYFDILNFLMSDEVPEESVSPNFNRVLDHSNGFSNSINPTRGNIKCGREKKKYKTQEDFRFVFRTKSDLEFMDDGFKWRKYGKKVVKSSPNPRNYFKCTSEGCNVKKRVERDGEDSSYVITTYEGIHNHETPSTCHVVYCTSTTRSRSGTPQRTSLQYASSSISTRY